MKHLRILNLGGGDFQIFTSGRYGYYNIYIKKLDGHYACNAFVPENELDSYIKAWTNCKYVYKWI